MNDRDKYERQNKAIADFIEDYKKREDDIYYAEYNIPSKFKIKKLATESVQYRKIRYVYKGRTYWRRVVSKYNKGE